MWNGFDNNKEAYIRNGMFIWCIYQWYLPFLIDRSLVRHHLSLLVLQESGLAIWMTMNCFFEPENQRCFSTYFISTFSISISIWINSLNFCLFHVIPDQTYQDIFVPLDILQRCNTTLLYYIRISLKIHPRFWPKKK